MSVKTVVRIHISGSLEDGHLFGQVVTGIRDIPETEAGVMDLPYHLDSPTKVIIQENNNAPAAFRIVQDSDKPNNDILEIHLNGELPDSLKSQIFYRASETLYNMHWFGRQISSTEINVRTNLM